MGITNDLTERKQAERDLRNSLAEKVALLNEVHHRVKNNLQIVTSLLNLQASRTSSGEAREVLKDTGHRVRSMALLHEILYKGGNLADINFAVYVGELCNQLMRSFGAVSERVRLECRITPIKLPMEQAMPCGLIINELVSNALKHAFPENRSGKITVTLDEGEGDQLVLCVGDDGIGLPDGADPFGASTLGLRLITTLANQLGGRVEIGRDEARDGVKFKVLWPGLKEDVAASAS